MNSYKVRLVAKPGTSGGSTSVIIEANTEFQAKQLASTQYGSDYTISTVINA